jgi:hypothetical protein
MIELTYCTLPEGELVNCRPIGRNPHGALFTVPAVKLQGAGRPFREQVGTQELGRMHGAAGRTAIILIAVTRECVDSILIPSRFLFR